MRPTKKQIELAAAAIIGMLRQESGIWNPAYIAQAKWPKSFRPAERKEAMAIAKAALSAALSGRQT